MRDCNITEYEGVKYVKISLEESDFIKTFNLESKNVRFKVSVDSIGFRSISGRIQDDQLSDSSVFLSSETFQMTGIFRDTNLDTEHNLKLGIVFKNISDDIGTFIGSGKCVEIL
ncbi:MAG TPA: hypothetical protein VEG44_10940 [Candidatus Acidoferrales bacterium]|nr:hypothetical protein [Candidatus Acidoferrales bacterium]